jgi:hypothetical protein
VAMTLAKYEDSLSLNGLTTLSGDLARVLCQRRRSLSLNGLTSLTEESAEALGQSRCDLSLDGLATLSLTLAKALCQCKRSLSFDGLLSLPDDVAEVLGQSGSGFSAQESFGLPGLNLADVDEAMFEAAFSLPEDAEDIDDVLLGREQDVFDLGANARQEEVPQDDGKSSPPLTELSLCGLCTLSDKAAKALGEYKGILWLLGLQTLSAEAAKAIRAHVEWTAILEE